MLYKLLARQVSELLKLPETGMGYQVVEATIDRTYIRERFLVLNSEVVIEMNGKEAIFFRKVMNEGINALKETANFIILNSISVLSEMQFRTLLNESKSDNERGAIENPIVNTNGEEVFVRLSAFINDRRVDKVNKCLLAGSFTTMLDDYLTCKSTNDDPVERYALPNNDKIKFAFHIQPLKTDPLQRGKVQPANSKRGGGKEVFFVSGTAAGTLKRETTY